MENLDTVSVSESEAELDSVSESESEAELDFEKEIKVIDDTQKGTTLGDPDGPVRFIETLGCKVPTYIDPRMDLLVKNARKKFKHLDYHVPFAMRNVFRLEQWPRAYRKKISGPGVESNLRINDEGFVMCEGINKGARSGTRTSIAGSRCGKRAVNRTHFCAIHGGALHPADKKMSVDTVAMSLVPQDRVEKLDRVAQFMQGFISPADLDDDEITGGFVRRSDGIAIPAKALGRKFETLITKELQTRLNHYLRSKTPRALEVMYEIMNSDLVEPADRIKASQFIIERTMGKTPDVILSGGMNEKPYEGILDAIESGSREDYRKQVASTRAEIGQQNCRSGISSIDRLSAVLDVEVDEDDVEVDDVEAEVDDVEAEVDDVDVEAEAYVNNSGENISTLKAVEKSIEDRNEIRKRASELRKARQRAKQRRFAARAVGATTTENVGFLVEWKIITNVNSEDFGKFKMVLHHPDTITEKLLERVDESNDPTRQLEALAEASKAAGVT